MRLICPNCGAQYEIDANLIPAAGRDVQCSDCGHTWLETPGASLAREAEPARKAETQPDPIAEPQPEPEPAGYEDLDGLPLDMGDAVVSVSPAAQESPDSLPTKTPAQPALSDNVAQILREEADYERQQRRREAEQIETQPDLDLHVAAPTRRELLPNIEEINSSLRGEDDPATTVKTPQRRSGFWAGFLFIVLIALLALLAYLFAPQISETVPEAKPALDGYVIWVNEMRLRLFEIVETMQAPQS